ncbi:MAG: hypothetical protein IJ543_08790 [Bacteroidales bacterium]|nr:hypothetical protein [Bacteroidales bacterium]
MKTKNIFKTLILAAVLVSACSKNDIADDFKGYTLPVTINVTRQGDEGTRASYNESTRKLSFSAGDKLFVAGNHTDAGSFAGVLDYDAVSGNFSGTVTTKKDYTGTIDGLMASAYAILLPAGYGSYEFFSVSGSGSNAGISFYLTKAFALTKAAAVEQFSVEYAYSYSSGFALAPMNAIASFTISGLTANKEVAVNFDTNGNGVISGNVTTSAEGVATFAVGVSTGRNLEDCTLTVDGNAIAMPTKTTVAGHIYNISRSAAPVVALEFVTFSDGTNTVEVATMNLGATSVADGTSCYGNYYAWGATETFGTVAYTAYNAGTVTPTTGHVGGYSQANAPYYENDAYIKYTSASDATLEAADDAVAANMPGCHMPTQAEVQTLYAACGGTGEAMTPPSISDGDAYEQGIYWVEGATSSITIGGDEYKANGVLFVQDATHHVFFPATGNVNGTTLYSAGSSGNYWYSSLRTEYISNAYRLNFSKSFFGNRVDTGSFGNRYYGFPVRPFKD